MKPSENLRQVLSDEIDRFDRESQRHKKIHRRCELLLILLAAMTTVVAALGLVLPNKPTEIQFAVIALSATSTAIGAWAQARRARELWQHEREVYYGLLDIRRELQFRCSLGELQQSEIERLFERANAVLGSSTARWTSILQRQRDQAQPTQQGEG